VLGLRLNSMILKVFSNRNDSMNLNALTTSSNDAAPLMGQVQDSKLFLTHLTWRVAAQELHPSLSPAFDTKQKCACSILQEYYNSSLRKMKGW